MDEGQDFLDSWWDPLMLSLADLDGGIVYVFHDDNQKLYRRSNAFPAGMLEIPLQENLRNTRRISALTEHFYQGPPMRALGPEGQDVERIVIHDASEIERQVSRVLHHLIKDNGVAPADIAVLMGSGRACPLRKGQRIGAFETTTDQAAEPSKVLLETVRRFKGLERPVVILTAIDDLPAAEETALLYCGLSRARAPPRHRRHRGDDGEGGWRRRLVRRPGRRGRRSSRRNQPLAWTMFAITDNK